MKLEAFESARPGQDEDLAHVVRISALASTETEDKRGGYIFLRHEVGEDSAQDRFRRGLDAADAQWFCVVGIFEGVLFGVSTVEVQTLSSGEEMGVLHDFVVDSEAQDIGIGEAMMNLVVETLTTRGCIGVDAWALPGDRATKNFFESFGLKARLLTAHRRF